MPSTMRVDVILKTYRGRRWIGEAIDSVLDQTYPDWHLTVVDDACPEHTGNYVRDRYGADARITVIRLPSNVGPVSAQSEGVRRSSNELIGFIDQDDLWHPEKLARQVERFQREPWADVVHTNHGYIDETGALVEGWGDWSNKRRVDIPWDELHPHEIARSLFLVNSVRLVTSVVRRDAYEGVGGYNEKLDAAADWEFWVRFAATGHRIAHVPENLVQKRIHKNQYTVTRGRALLDKRLAAAEELVGRFSFLSDLADERKEFLLMWKVSETFKVRDMSAVRDALRELVRLRGMRPRYAAAWFLSYLGPVQAPVVRVYRALLRGRRHRALDYAPNGARLAEGADPEAIPSESARDGT